MPSSRLPETERAAALRRRPTPASDGEAAEGGQAQHPLIALQRQVGNAQIARMLAQREGGDDEEELQAKRDPAIQREEEEEELQAKRDPAIQREGEEEEMQTMRDPALQREGEEEELQAKPEVGMAGGPISEGLSSRIGAQRGGGATLDSGTRETMEGHFGTSLADVRVHTDSESDALNRSVGAKAFTTGNDIFFRKDTSPGDSALLAHELTHVVQQRSMSHSGPASVGPADDAYEREADSVSSAITTGAAAQAQREAAEEEELQAKRDPAIQREEAAEESEEGS